MKDWPVYQNDLSETAGLIVFAKKAKGSFRDNQPCLEITDGLVALPCPEMASGRVTVDILADGPAYPGIAFGIRDPYNYDLIYAQPHTSGKWDAVQYDPVFCGSNTWQIFHGPAYQAPAIVPTGKWFTMQVDFCESFARASIDGQPSSFVRRVKRVKRTGLLGLWTYRPAYFRNIRVEEAEHDLMSDAHKPEEESCKDGEHGERFYRPVKTWLMEGFGIVESEPSGLLLVNRYAPLSLGEVTLTRKFRLPEATRIDLRYGYSDIFSIAVDDLVIFSGTNTFTGFSDRDARGYVDPSAHDMAWNVEAGVHTLKIVLRVREPFGWGMGLSMAGKGLEFLPPWMT